ncbi:heat shock 70 kDa protein [Jimgerdemannia flammicorona]|uniref:Heat shock 70 kDa protein n=1 Tax=Jimgerdemannia flammicorona TaxID=994334 RepID=A0A433Q4T0_9FUNG|nr:heat shock 70 kDa protein [Jimgerdemannia flammicorona]
MAKAEENEIVVIAIDLGTTYSRVAVCYDENRVELIADDQGHYDIPSYVAFTDNVRLFGNAAKSHYHSDPDRTILDARYLLGRRFDDPEVQAYMERFPFKVVEREGQPVFEVQVKGENEIFTPEDIYAMMLSRMKEIAETYLEKNVTHVFVTVPSYFNNTQRQAIKNAGAIAGLAIYRIFNEPSSATFAYHLNELKDETNILVYDLGGSTLNVSLVLAEEGIFEILATAGDAHLGGRDFDRRLVEHLVRTWREENDGEDVIEDAAIVARLQHEAEEAKRVLSSQDSVHIEIKSFFGGKHLSKTITRAEFEELNDDLFRETLKHVEQVLSHANLQKTDVHEIVLAGGSAHIPKVQELLEVFFGGKKALMGVEPDKLVVYGAARQGGDFHKNSHTSFCCFLDVISVPLGVETAGGVMTEMLSRNAFYPISKTQIFSTVADDQATTVIRVFSGERAMTRYNRRIAELELTDLPAGPRGVAKIQVTFEVDANGYLTVSAHPLGREWQTVRTTMPLDFSADAFESREREKSQEEDRLFREKAVSRNALETLLHSLRSRLPDGFRLDDRVSAEHRERIVEVVNRELLEWLNEHSDGPVVTRDDGERPKRVQGVIPDVVSMLSGTDGR